jgi:hypothetical protein
LSTLVSTQVLSILGQSFTISFTNLLSINVKLFLDEQSWCYIEKLENTHLWEGNCTIEFVYNNMSLWMKKEKMKLFLSLLCVDPTTITCLLTPRHLLT